jgi:hypothetical protein
MVSVTFPYGHILRFLDHIFTDTSFITFKEVLYTPDYSVLYFIYADL